MYYISILFFFSCISIRVLALPSPGILAHLFDAVLCFPTQLFFCFGRIAVAHSDVACTSRFDLVFYFMTACFFKCVNHIQYAVAMSCSQVVYTNFRFFFQFLQCFYMTYCQVYYMDVITYAGSIRSIIVITEYSQLRSGMNSLSPSGEPPFC